MSYTGTEAAHIVGITYRQLDYWERTDLLKPSLAPARGSGTRRGYSYRDLIELRMIRAMLDAGLHLTAVRTVMGQLHLRPAFDLGRSTLVISALGVRLVDEDELLDIVRSGTEMINVLPMAGVMDAIDEALHGVPVAAAV